MVFFQEGIAVVDDGCMSVAFVALGIGQEHAAYVDIVGKGAPIYIPVVWVGLAAKNLRVFNYKE